MAKSNTSESASTRGKGEVGAANAGWRGCSVPREAGIMAARLSEWHAHLLHQRIGGVKSRAADELMRLKALVGDLTMRLDLSWKAVSRLRGQRRFSCRKVDAMSQPRRLPRIVAMVCIASARSEGCFAVSKKSRAVQAY